MTNRRDIFHLGAKSLFCVGGLIRQKDDDVSAQLSVDDCVAVLIVVALSCNIINHVSLSESAVTDPVINRK